MLRALAILLFSVPAFAQQKKYFEYHSPRAMVITPEVETKLCDAEWRGDAVEQIIRGDTSAHLPYISVKYSADHTYQCGKVRGRWEVRHRRYLVHTPDSRDQRSRMISGIYSVISLSDTSLVLQSLQTSTHDMLRTMFFKREGTSRFVHPKIPQRPPGYALQAPVVDPAMIDSVRALSDEAFFTHGFNYTKDSVEIDSGEKKRWFLRIKKSE